MRAPVVVPLTLALALALGLAVGGCGDDPACPADQPAACPATVPSYQAQIAPTLTAACATECHGPGGVSSNKPLGSYAEVFKRRGSVLGQLVNCLMPPSGATPLTATQRAELLAWLVCGAPNN